MAEMWVQTTRAPDAAEAVLETVPFVMRAIRTRMRAVATADLSVPQFRTLLYVRRVPGTSLSGIADHLGITLPAASELVARLVHQGFLARSRDQAERRRIQLELTDAGRATLAEMEARTKEWLRAVLARTDPERRTALVAALGDLRAAVAAADEATAWHPAGGGVEVGPAGPR